MTDEQQTPVDAPEAVLVMTPSDSGHDSALYLREYAQAGEAEYFTSRVHGALWVGNVPGLADTETTLGLSVKPLDALDADLARHRDDTVDDDALRQTID